VGSIKSVLRIVGACGWWVAEGDSYVSGFMVRKMVLAWVEGMKAKGKIQAIDWGEVSRDVLMEACADETGYLEVFDTESTAEDISNIMFSRPDLGIFVSMYCCLFKEACEMWPHKVPDIIASLRDGRFQRKVHALRAEYEGVTPCPFRVCQSLLVTPPKTRTQKAKYGSK
jgi:hypothetical protein